MSNQVQGGIISADDVTDDQTSADQENAHSTGLILHVSVSDTAGTFAYTPSVEVKFGGTYTEIFSASADLNSSGEYLYIIHPGVADSTSPNGNHVEETAQLPVPRTWRAKVAATTADASNQADIDVNVATIT